MEDEELPAQRYERDLVQKLKVLRHELSLQQPQAGHPMLCCKLLGVGASESEQSSTEFYSSPLHSILDTFSFDIQP